MCIIVQVEWVFAFCLIVEPGLHACMHARHWLFSAEFSYCIEPPRSKQNANDTAANVQPPSRKQQSSKLCLILFTLSAHAAHSAQS